MEFRELRLPGVIEITLAPHLDDRGFFMRTYDAGLFEMHGINTNWVQENHSRSEKKGIIRGLHFQIEPFSETKLVRCIHGEIFDVAVDLRKGSATFGKWTGINLSEENMKMFFIPRGFAHGFCTLTEVSEVVYKVDNFYSQAHERGLIWSDPDIGIDWPIKEPVLSAKDRRNMRLKDWMIERLDD
ncbi:MAG: dTDP-4-dehydrorhamnose 3,5-epimerase [Bacteroidales bacterium]|nr:dTDP-4-dehydrorhamnose 3,5-epimerase [Bacteroidales bacterium]